MVIKKDLSNLPSGGGGDDPSRPDAVPRFMPALAEAWYEAFRRDEDKPTAIAGVRVRASEAGMCARSIAYSIERRDVLNDPDADELAIKRVAVSNPPSIADAWRMGLGTMVHEALEQVFTKAFPDAEVEVTVDLRPDVDGACTADIIIREPIDGKGGFHVTVIEVKTINGWGFKKAIGSQGSAEGVRSSHLLQAALAAAAIDADEVVIGYLAMELLSPDVARRAGVDEIGRFSAEWTFDRDQYRPLAVAEGKRLNRIIARVDEGGPTNVPRSIPDLPARSVIRNPKNGMWTLTEDGAITASGTTWQCGYCRWQDRCAGDA